MTIPDQSDVIAFEFYLIKTAWHLFGLKKMLRFALGLPTVLFTKKNRSAYEFMGICTTKLDDTTLYWKHPDVRFIDEVIIRQVYIPNRGFELKDDYVVVDAGANIGTFSLLAASRAKRGIVYSIEPDKNEFRRLNENVKINNFQNVITINEALTDVVKVIPFSDGSVQSDSNLTKIPKYSYEGPVMSITIKELMHKYNIDKIDFLKLDIEGSEFQVFKDTSWLKKVKIISMELHDHIESENVKNIINSLKLDNFSVNTVIENKTLYCYAKQV